MLRFRYSVGRNLKHSANFKHWKKIISSFSKTRIDFSLFVSAKCLIFAHPSCIPCVQSNTFTIKKDKIDNDQCFQTLTTFAYFKIQISKLTKFGFGDVVLIYFDQGGNDSVFLQD